MSISPFLKRIAVKFGVDPLDIEFHTTVPRGPYKAFKIGGPISDDTLPKRKLSGLKPPPAAWFGAQTTTGQGLQFPQG